jgi:hypothetical protein
MTHQGQCLTTRRPLCLVEDLASGGQHTTTMTQYDTILARLAIPTLARVRVCCPCCRVLVAQNCFARDDLVPLH